MNERRKGPLRRQLADRRTRGERRMEPRGAFNLEAWRAVRRRGFKRLFDRQGRSDENTRRNANEWWKKLDRRSGTDRRQQPDRRSI